MTHLVLDAKELVYTFQALEFTGNPLIFLDSELVLGESFSNASKILNTEARMVPFEVPDNAWTQELEAKVGNTARLIANKQTHTKI